MTAPNRTLLIVDGGVPGLLACAVASERHRPRMAPLAWVPGAAEPERARAAQRQGELLQVEVIIGSDPSTHTDQGHAETRTLLNAAYAAAERGIQTVVWPVCAGAVEADLDRISTATDRALLAARLVSVGMDRPITIETPYVDLTHRQLADLILDMDLPIWLCWWADSPSPAAAQEREHWHAMLRAAGWEGALPGPELSVTVRPSRAPAPESR